MLSALLGFLGGVIGGSLSAHLSHLYQQKRDAQKHHEAALEELKEALNQLRELIFPFFGRRDEATSERAWKAYSKAQEIEEIASRLNDKALKRRIVSAMSGRHDSLGELVKELEGIRQEIREQLFPTVHGERKGYRSERAEETFGVLFSSTSDSEPVLWGPSSLGFLDFLESKGLIGMQNAREE